MYPFNTPADDNSSFSLLSFLCLWVCFTCIFLSYVTLAQATDRYATLLAENISEPELKESIDTSAENSQPSTSENEEFRDPFEPGDKQIKKTISDPFEPINRGTYWFNDKVYLYGLEPMASAWHGIVPHYGRVRVKNFFRNLDEPKNFVNSLLQGNFFGAMVSSSRFIINSTVGIAGLYDPASMGSKPVKTGFDRTLSTWGIGTGPYVTIPILGPSTARGTVGLFVDGLFYPPNYIEGEDSTLVISGLSVSRNVNETSFRLGEYESLKENAVDPYTALKNAYIQDLRNGD